ncbi:NAD+ synthase [Paraburkholderia sp. UCT31]|uniref:NAD+ synthase n=1 Tax=Paraburkholderia sp. UCT31 TaxID=2615209 RepID=UPI00165575C2|nr:NAD+ synthase [Paraburkholderia sp. UCT31]MBC8741721.1 NAD+ synthase [Paraburkholderia sp. UCT31]
MEKKSVSIAMVQLNYKLNDFEGNAQKILTAVGKNRDADLVVCSELCLSGYYPQDLVEEPDFLLRQQVALDAILEASRHTSSTIVVGAFTKNTGVGKPLRNSLLAIRDGDVVLRYSKQLLVEGGIFNERRHTEPGRHNPAILFLNGARIGFAICEDMWNVDGKQYEANPVADLVEEGVDAIVSINASPSHVGKREYRHELFLDIARAHRLPVVYVNQVGADDSIVFDGASFIADPARGIVTELASFEEATSLVEMHFYAHGTEYRIFDASRAPLEQQAPVYLDDEEFFYRQTILGLRDYARKVGFGSVVVGSSGGIDSALTLALAVDALGAENVKAVTMPSRFSSAGSVDDSVTLCRNLGIELFTHEIGTLYNGYVEGFKKSFERAPAQLTRENVQARIRGAILMEYSNDFGCMLLTTGNKSENGVGYATLYGDTNGGLGLIGDLYKTEVFEVARFYNKLHGRELIPNSIIEKAPSAELSEGQKDTDSLPPYEVLDEILKWHLEGTRLRPAEYAKAKALVERLRANGDSALVERVLGMVKRSEFKRRQAAPIIRVRSRAFGNGRQIPISAA